MAVYEVIQGMCRTWNECATDDIDPKNDGPSSPTNPWGDKPKKKNPKSEP